MEKRNKAKNTPEPQILTSEGREVEQVVRHSKLREFLKPTKQKRAYLLILSMFLGIAFAFICVGAQYGHEMAYWLAYWVLMALSFPSFLLWGNYGSEPLSGLGMPFYIFAIFIQTLWLYLISCSLSLFIKWKKVEK